MTQRGPQIAPSSSRQSDGGTRLWLQQLCLRFSVGPCKKALTALGLPRPRAVVRMDGVCRVGGAAADWEVGGMGAWLHGASPEKKQEYWDSF